jgi:Mg2+-importing ATPase
VSATTDLQRTGAEEAAVVLHRLGSSDIGLSTKEAHRRLAETGRNAVTHHGVQALAVLLRQLRNPLLILLGAATATAFALGERSDALIILVIVSISVGLGFINEYRSERAVAELHSRIRHTALVIRDGKPSSVDVTELVPGDVVMLNVGDIVPADMRLLEVQTLECDEAVLTGESMTRAKTAAATPASDAPLKLPSCAYMGTVVRAGAGRGVVVATGVRTLFGQVAQALGRRPPETAFQRGLRDFSVLLLWVTFALTGSIFVLNALLGRPLLEAALFSLAVAVGLTPQLLPAIVTISLSVGARRLARRSVVVKRLVSIEDLGNIQVLFTDKTGTLTQGQITYQAALNPAGNPSPDVFRLGLLCNSATRDGATVVGGNPLDRALWEAADVPPAGYRRIAEAPFDYDRKLMSVLVQAPDGERVIISKGAPEAILARCLDVPASAGPCWTGCSTRARGWSRSPTGGHPTWPGLRRPTNPG